MKAFKAISIVVAVAIGAWFPSAAGAGQEGRIDRAPMADFGLYERVPDPELAKMRGGFVIPTGLLNFAIDLAAQINGQPIYQGRLTFSPGTGVTNEIEHFDTSGFGVPVTGNVNVNDAISQVVTSVQAGDGNVAPAAFADAEGVVLTVQNTLSNVVIQQQMRLQLDLEAGAFMESPAGLSLRNRMRQLGGLGLSR